MALMSNKGGNMFEKFIQNILTRIDKIIKLIEANGKRIIFIAVVVGIPAVFGLSYFLNYLETSTMQGKCTSNWFNTSAIHGWDRGIPECWSEGDWLFDCDRSVYGKTRESERRMRVCFTPSSIF